MPTDVARWSQITCREVHNSRREWFDKNGQFRASVKLECDWDDRFKLVADLYTSAYGIKLPASTVGYHPRVYPHVGSVAAGPDSMPAPTMNKIGVDSVTLMNVEDAFTTDSYKETITPKSVARVDVQYGRHYNIQESIEWDVQAVTQSYQHFKWATDLSGGGVDSGLLGELESPVATYSTAVLTREYIGLGLPTQSRPLVPDITKLIECVNFVNHEAYTSTQLGITFKSGTLLMLEPEVQSSVDMQNVWNPTPALSPNTFGAQGLTVRVRFLYKPGSPQLQGGPDTSVDTHNQFWRARMKRAGSSKRGGWDRLKVQDPATPTSGYDDFVPFDPNPLIKQHWLIDGSTPNPVQIP